MTITTAKLPAAIARAFAGSAPAAAALATLAVLCTPVQAQWRLSKTVDYGAILTDNAGRRSDARKTGNLIFEVAPAIEARLYGPRLKAEVDYKLRLYQPVRSVAGSRRTSQALRSNMQAELVNDTIYLDASAGIRQAGISPFAPIVNAFSDDNADNVRTWQISPYLRNRFGNLANTEVRYTLDGVHAGRSGLRDTRGETVSVLLKSGRHWDDFGFDVRASDQTIHDNLRDDGRIQVAQANLSYQLLRYLSITAGRNYDNYNYESIGGANGGSGWNAGFTWTPSRRTSVTVNNGRRYYGPSRILKAMHRSRHTVWNISYDDSVTSTRANFLLPAALDTSAMIDSLLIPRIPDPLERSRAVDEYIRVIGLPPSLAEDINFFSNRFALQKAARASVAVRGARTNVVLGAYKVRREALSIRAVDTSLLGNPTNSINDDIDQRGVSASVTYALNGNSTLSAVADVSDNLSLTTGFEARNSIITFGLRQRLQAKMDARVELRHVRGTTGLLSGLPYSETALTAHLTMKY